MINPTNENEHYRTTDLGCATALSVVGIELLSLDHSNPRRVVFIFAKSEELDDVSKCYWSGTLPVDAKSFFEALKWLKSRVYNG